MMRKTDKVSKSVRVAALNREVVVTTQGGRDEERTKTAYWEKWAAQAVKEIMEEIRQAEDGLKLKQALYSGRVGREPRRTRSPSEESMACTELSLLTCSALDREEQRVTGRKKRRKKSANNRPEEPKPDWVKMARERRGYVLNKFIRRDAGLLDAYVGGQASSDVMTSGDRMLLTKAAYSKGLGGICKSQSTENVISAVLKPPPTSTSRSSSRASQGLLHRSRRRCQSPRILAADQRRKQPQRSQSMSIQNRSLTFLHKRTFPLPSSPFAPAPRLPSSCSTNVDVDSPQNIQHDEAVLTKLQATLETLQRCTGYGDGCAVLSIMPDERGRFTDADYARIPRYPQHIRVAPQLSRVIREQVQQRVTRPKKNTIKTKDMQRLEAENPVMQRSHQNLLIFNWLNSLGDRDYSGTNRAPSIYDLEEGVAPDLKFHPRLFTELVEGVTMSSTVAHTEVTSVRSTQDNLEDDLAELYDEEWGSEPATDTGTVQT